MIVLVAGTATEVGKTWVAAALARALRARGRSVVARKPAQSYAAGDDAAGCTDAQLLAAATGEHPDAVCPRARWYPLAMAPPMAAEALGRPAFTVADLAGEVSRSLPAGDEPVALVESAGGVRSPLADDGDTVTLAERLRPDVTVLVADAGLGTINAVRLSADALLRAGIGEPVVFLNRLDPTDTLHRDNARWLGERFGLRCVTSVTDLTDFVDGPGRVRFNGGPAGDRP